MYAGDYKYLKWVLYIILNSRPFCFSFTSFIANGFCNTLFCYACRNPSEEKIVEDFLVKEGLDIDKSSKILDIIKQMGTYLLILRFIFVH